MNGGAQEPEASGVPLAELIAAATPRREQSRGSRHKARELTLQALYQSEIGGEGIERAVDHLCEENGAGHADLAYFRTLAAGAWSRRQELDGWIAKAAANWSLQRIATIDLSILRQGAYELLAEPQLPVRVVINEAIELSKRYGGDGSRAFVNGVMDRLAALLRQGGDEEGLPDEAATQGNAQTVPPEVVP
ncbi:MAG: transcription antitermination factor NusB [Magnetococcales bacterium]|nr:transcription antitermination factor NusB [Magnetococcales bacterium]